MESVNNFFKILHTVCMKKIILLTALTLIISSTALLGCAEGTTHGMSSAAGESVQQTESSEHTKGTTINESYENAEGDEDRRKDGCDDGHCKEPDADNDKTDEDAAPEHLHRDPRRGHGRRPKPRPMPRQYR